MTNPILIFLKNKNIIETYSIENRNGKLVIPPGFLKKGKKKKEVKSYKIELKDIESIEVPEAEEILPVLERA